MKKIIIPLLFVILFLNIFGAYNKSHHYDELAYIGKGIYLVKTHNFLLAETGHPMLSHYLGGLFTLPLNFDSTLYDEEDAWELGHNFVYNSKYDADLVIFLFRLPMALLSILLGYFVFLWTKSIYNEKAGLFALFLYAFSPNILAYSRFALTDICFITFFFIASYFFWKFLKEPTRINIMLSGITLGLAFISKVTSIFLILIFFIALILNSRSKKIISWFLSFFMILIISLVIINAAYLFQGTFNSINTNVLQDDGLDIDMYLKSRESVPSFVNIFVDNFPEMLPYPYLKTLYFDSAFSRIGRSERNTDAVYSTCFFLGKVYSKQPLFYYPLLIFFQIPIPLLILLVLSIFFFFAKKNKNRFNEIYLLLPVIIIIPIFIFVIQMCSDEMRHLLLIYPFLFVFASKIFERKIHNKKLFNIFIAVLCIWYFLSSMLVFPHFTAYSNEFLGYNNYLQLYDSGFDTKLLAEFLLRNNITEIKYSHSSTVLPEYHTKGKVKFEYLPGHGFVWVHQNKSIICGYQKGLIAIDSRSLYDFRESPGCYDWLKSYKPIKMVGYGIYVYNVT